VTLAATPGTVSPRETMQDKSRLLPVALYLPTGSDARIAARVLGSSGFDVTTASAMSEICRLIEDADAAVLVIGEEALSREAREELFESLNAQPSWSDIPIVLLTGEGELSSSLPGVLSGLTLKGNVTLLERPVRVATLTTVIRSAQRARQRQLDVRDLVEKERAARLQAEDANSAKSTFLATMSHELRTPLNAIGGYTQLLMLGVRGDLRQEQLADLERIDRAQRHLLSLINDILNFAKIEAGQVEIERVPVRMDEILAGLGEFVEPQLREKGVAFAIRNESRGTEAMGDPDKVRQILINLLSNAIKFIPERGRIVMACDADEAAVRITIEDDGIGIPPDKLETIFEPFVQLGRDFSTPHGGTGLGLSISRDLARRMGGDLMVESEMGHGSRFTLMLERA
jgi:signal transduction histidine kinase